MFGGNHTCRFKFLLEPVSSDLFHLLISHRTNASDKSKAGAHFSHYWKKKKEWIDLNVRIKLIKKKKKPLGSFSNKGKSIYHFASGEDY